MASESESVSNMNPCSAAAEMMETRPLFRQSSIYSLTMDEFQHAVCEPGKTFGSMNMDEFLTSIWTAEENQAIMAALGAAAPSNPHLDNVNPAKSLSSLSRQPSLHRQGSLTLPAPLCRKTVEEVWSQIHKGNYPDQQLGQGERGDPPDNVAKASRQPTLGEMTLEDFLIRAGVVRKGSAASLPPQPTVPQMSLGLPAAYQIGDAGGVKLGGFGVPPAAMGDGGARKQTLEGPVEMVVERRQRRMIKNRESAARSRARKQAYTVELEAELEQLRKENAGLKKEREEAEQRRKKKALETLNARTLISMKSKSMRLRRTVTGPW